MGKAFRRGIRTVGALRTVVSHLVASRTGFGDCCVLALEPCRVWVQDCAGLESRGKYAATAVRLLEIVGSRPG